METTGNAILNKTGVLELSTLVDTARERLSCAPVGLAEEVRRAIDAIPKVVNHVCTGLGRKNTLTRDQLVSVFDRAIVSAVAGNEALEPMLRRAITKDFIHSLFDAVAVEKRLTVGKTGRLR